MNLRVIGAGLPRTGTTSLKAALEHLLGKPCYHMFEVMENREHGVEWWKALAGETQAMQVALEGYGAAVDWPASVLWRELLAENPDAVILLSHRGDAETWWKSVDRTVWGMMRKPDADPMIAEFNRAMRVKAGLGDDWDDPAVAKAFYDELYRDVVASAPPEQLLIWQPGDGWEPLCTALNLPIPDIDFPHKNTTSEFRERGGMDD